MLDDGRQRHRQRGRECADARGADAELLDDPAAGWIRERLQELVDVGGLVNHALNYLRFNAKVKRELKCYGSGSGSAG